MSLKRSLCLVLPLVGGLLMGSGHDSYEPCPDEPDLTLHVDGLNGTAHAPETAGLSWNDPYLLLQDALEHARLHLAENEEDTVLIKVAGYDSEDEQAPRFVYRPDQRYDHPEGQTGPGAGSCADLFEGVTCPPFGDCNRDIAFELHNRIVLFGGFPAGGGDCEDRDPGRYHTVLSGDLGVNVDLTPHGLYCRDIVTIVGEGETFEDIEFTSHRHWDNSKSVVRAVNVNPSAVVDGFVIRGGQGTYGGNDAAVAVINASPTMRHCWIERNISGAATSKLDTTAVLIEGVSGPRILHCTIRHNSLEGSGAAVHIGDDAEPVFIGCTFDENIMSAIWVVGTGKATVINSIVRDNLTLNPGI
jgi:hypothetical protein